MRPDSKHINHMKRLLCGTGCVYRSNVYFLSLISVFMPVMKMALQGDIKSIELNWIVLLCDLWLPGTDRPLIKRLFVSLSALALPINEVCKLNCRRTRWGEDNKETTRQGQTTRRGQREGLNEEVTMWRRQRVRVNEDTTRRRSNVVEAMRRT